MAWIIQNQLLIFGIFLATLTGGPFILSASGLNCGYPGSPAYGRPVPIRNSYSPGSTVGYSCAIGHTLMGQMKRVCRQNGTWSANIPICERSLPRMDQHASSRATLAMYDPQKTIDGLRDTCTYTDKKKPRWIRVDLGNSFNVQAVAITVPGNMYLVENAQFTIYVISVRDATTASYHKCADFNGKFSTPTVKLPCHGIGIQGSYVHIEDNRKNVDYFSICEIEVFAQKDVYECGEPDRPANSYTTNPEAGIVDYRCMHGFQLVGSSRRHCLPNGQWSGVQPLCREVVCPSLKEVANGTIQYIGTSSEDSRPRQDTIANLTCDYGYQAKGFQTVQCLESGQWSGEFLDCDPVDCKEPSFPENNYVLVNGSTTYGSVAILYCHKNKNDIRESEAMLMCREDGRWSPEVDCSQKKSASTLELFEEEENAVPNGVIIGMAVVVLFLLLVLILLLLFKRKQLMRRTSTESLPSKETTTSSELKDGSQDGGIENDDFYASISAEDEKQTPSEQETPTKIRAVEKGILSSILFAKRKLQTQSKSKESKDLAKSNSALNSNGELEHSPSPSDPPEMIQPVYAKVDLDEKRRSRLVKSLAEHLDCAPRNSTNPVVYAPEQDLDSEPVKLRELPPIPLDDTQSTNSSTYASLSRPLEPPPEPIIMKKNDFYQGRRVMMPPYLDSRTTILKDNDLYTIT